MGEVEAEEANEVEEDERECAFSDEDQEEQVTAERQKAAEEEDQEDFGSHAWWLQKERMRRQAAERTRRRCCPPHGFAWRNEVQRRLRKQLRALKEAQLQLDSRPLDPEWQRVRECFNAEVERLEQCDREWRRIDREW